MIYFDTAYLAKLYLHEPDAASVRSVAAEVEVVACCGHGMIELAYVLHRKFREGTITREELKVYLNQVKADAMKGFLVWFPVEASLLSQAQDSILSLDKKTYLRASDALHLACAREHGFKTIYSNDAHLLTAAKHFGLRGKNVIK